MRFVHELVRLPMLTQPMVWGSLRLSNHRKRASSLSLRSTYCHGMLSASSRLCWPSHWFGVPRASATLVGRAGRKPLVRRIGDAVMGGMVCSLQGCSDTTTGWCARVWQAHCRALLAQLGVGVPGRSATLGVRAGRVAEWCPGMGDSAMGWAAWRGPRSGRRGKGARRRGRGRALLRGGTRGRGEC